MKTDDRATRERDEVKDDEAKVVRLRDWLAPEDELVPFGPRAHAARTPTEGRADPDPSAEPPAASGFWDGDPAVHTAVPGPGIFDEPGERTAGRRRYRHRAPVWRPALPALHPFNWGAPARGLIGDLVDRITWRWAAAGVAFSALALIVFAFALGASSSGHHQPPAHVAIGGPAQVSLSRTISEIGAATRAAAAADLRRRPSVDAAAVRMIGGAAERAQALQRRRRHHAVTPVSRSSSRTTGSSETQSPTPAPRTTQASNQPMYTPPPSPGSSTGSSSISGVSAPATSSGGSSASGTKSGTPPCEIGALGCQ